MKAPSYEEGEKPCFDKEVYHGPVSKDVSRQTHNPDCSVLNRDLFIGVPQIQASNTLVGNDHLWYFAYGSNMSAKKFTHDRGIVPLSSARVRLRGWKLAMLIPGLPYAEPAFSAIEKEETLRDRSRLTVTESAQKQASVPDVVGIAYQITLSQYHHVVASEGGGTGYEEVVLRAEPVSDEDACRIGPHLCVVTFCAGMRRKPEGRASRRYMVRAYFPSMKIKKNVSLLSILESLCSA